MQKSLLWSNQSLHGLCLDSLTISRKPQKINFAFLSFKRLTQVYFAKMSITVIKYLTPRLKEDHGLISAKPTVQIYPQA